MKNKKQIVAEKLNLDRPTPSNTAKKKISNIEVVDGKVVATFIENGMPMKKQFNDFQEFADYAETFFDMGGGMPEDELEENPFAQLGGTKRTTKPTPEELEGEEMV